MGITKNEDVMDAFRVITEDGNRIFLQELDENNKRDVKIKENTEKGTWDLVTINDVPIITAMFIAYYAVSNKVLTFTYRLKNENKEERKAIKLWF